MQLNVMPSVPLANRPVPEGRTPEPQAVEGQLPMRHQLSAGRAGGEGGEPDARSERLPYLRVHGRAQTAPDSSRYLHNYCMFSGSIVYCIKKGVRYFVFFSVLFNVVS